MRRTAVVFVLISLIGCKADGPRRDPSADRWKRSKATPRFTSEAILHERTGTGEVAYLGMDVDPETPKRGSVVTLTHYFKAIQPMNGDYDVFVHGEIPGRGGRVLVADHAPVVGRAPTNTWQKGEIWADVHKVAIPDDVPSGTIELRVGLFKGDVRFTVEAPPGGSDGENRVRAAALKLTGPVNDGLPVATVKRLNGEIVVDGKLDEAAWKNAEVLTMADTLGRGDPVKYPTKLRLLYDDEYLYVSFECTDVDITERYKKRDDPIYDHETVEVFLMPNVVAPALGPYVELQSSPGGIIFDASFDGRRQGMNKGFDAGQEIATTIDGTLNDPAPDTGWKTEWKVKFTNIRGVKTPPKAGDEWRMNAYRIEKYRKNGRLEGEYTGWSPPKIGDFHNVVRFGRMKFGS